MDNIAFRELIQDKQRFIETLLVIESKDSRRIPFKLNAIQADAQRTQTGRDIWVKPAQVGFSSERLATRLIDTITTPGTNTVLIAYEEFITQRLLDKAQFFYNALQSLNIPGFPRMHHNSSFQKTFPEIHSSMYISSARSYVAGRAETIHHLLADEYAFWEPGSVDRIFVPALDRVPPTGTCDVFSTPNGDDNDFADIYHIAKEGKSVFTAHFYPWFAHPEYTMYYNSPLLIRENTPAWAMELRESEFDLNLEEQVLIDKFGLTFDQIRWRRYKIKEKESLRRGGELVKLFPQEFPEDDVSCWLAAGDMYYDPDVINQKAKDCYPAPIHKEDMDVWYPPEENGQYIIAIDPGQAKVSQTSIAVLDFPEEIPRLCARGAGLWGPELTAYKAREIGKHYNYATLAWEANSHGLALGPLLKEYPNLYYRRDITTGRESAELGWYTGPKTKPYMLGMLARALDVMIVHDIEFLSQCRNIRQAGDKVIVVGADDIHDSVAIGLVCREVVPTFRGFVGTAGFKW